MNKLPRLAIAQNKLVHRWILVRNAGGGHGHELEEQHHDHGDRDGKPYKPFDPFSPLHGIIFELKKSE
jgi:hypothetical protein